MVQQYNSRSTKRILILNLSISFWILTTIVSLTTGESFSTSIPSQTKDRTDRSKVKGETLHSPLTHNTDFRAISRKFRTFTNSLIPNLANDGSSSGSNNNNLFPPSFGGTNNTIGTIGTSALLVKGGLLTLPSAIKGVVVQFLVTALVVLFLITGVAFFTCSLVNCQGILGGAGSGEDGSPLPNLPFLNNRNGYKYYDNFYPVMSTIDEAQQKYDVKSSLPSTMPFHH